MLESKWQLLNKIHLGEDSVFALRIACFRNGEISYPEAKELADELAGFANAKGGTLLLGVDGETREVAGIAMDSMDNVLNFVENICSDLVIPPLTARIIRLELPDSSGKARPILKIDVPRSLFVHRSPGGYLRRLGSSKKEKPPEVLARVFQQRSQASPPF